MADLEGVLWGWNSPTFVGNLSTNLDKNEKVIVCNPLPFFSYFPGTPLTPLSKYLDRHSIFVSYPAVDQICLFHPNSTSCLP